MGYSTQVLWVSWPKHVHTMLNRLLRTFSWQENLHHPWRNLAAAIAVMLGVALAFAVHLINASALSEFSSAVRAVNGQPDLEIRSSSGGMNEALYAAIAGHPSVALASPVLEVPTYALDAQGNKKSIKVVGVDALVVAGIAPSLMPVPPQMSNKSKDAGPKSSTGADAASDAVAFTNRFAIFSPGTVFLNAAAQAALPDAQGTQHITVLRSLQSASLTVAGSVAAGGGPLAVMDIAAAQELFGLQGQLSRIDVRLAAGANPAAFIHDLQLPANVQAQSPGDATDRISNLSRAYRVNMTVLALVALFTGAFLVFSVLSLSVAKRAQQFALLGVLGVTARDRLNLVLLEAAFLGFVGSAAGIALGTALAALALNMLGGDLGGGYFSGVAPPLQWNAWAAAIYGLLGVAAAMVGAWWPAQAARNLPLAQTLKGLGSTAKRGKGFIVALLFIAAGAIFTLAPAIFDIPLAAFVSIGLLLVGGIGLLPALVALAYDRIVPLVAYRALPLLAVERARRVRETAAVAVSGVVAALSLVVALTVMVASFRNSVMQWLDVVLPAPLYVRSASNVAAGQVLNFNPATVQAIRALPGVARVEGQRINGILLKPSQPAVAIIARWIDDPAKNFPLVSGPAAPASDVPAGAVPIYVSEPMVDLYQARLGHVFQLNMPQASVDIAQAATNLIVTKLAEPEPAYYVAGVWRDYARQFGAIAIDQRSYARITGDTRLNDLAVWPSDGTSAAAVQDAIRDAIARHIGKEAASANVPKTSNAPNLLNPAQAGTPALAMAMPDVSKLIEFSSATEIRDMSLKIFDRSFAVTYWLQAVAIAIGLFGVAASFSAQVLARRKEFGLLAHLGLTKKQILTVVASEGTAWTAIGSIAGCALGLVVATILVKVVNPQSFHWTMDMHIPWLRLAALCAAVVVAGTVTAWLAGRTAAGKDAVMAVKEDW